MLPHDDAELGQNLMHVGLLVEGKYTFCQESFSIFFFDRRRSFIPGGFESVPLAFCRSYRSFMEPRFDYRHLYSPRTHRTSTSNQTFVSIVTCSRYCHHHCCYHHLNITNSINVNTITRINSSDTRDIRNRVQE